MDIFCGAGGFSAGFHLNGFQIKHGIDSWQPAMSTFNYNYGLNCSVKDVLDFEYDVGQIECLPDTNVIVGSPPCVSFSNSNKSGKADKSLGVRLTETFLRIVTVKKYSKDSVLDAWFMENVPNSAKYLQDKYTFRDLNLEEWAQENGYSSEDVAISIADNSEILISADYGCPQVRKRLITSENVISSSKIIPNVTHSEKGKSDGLKDWITLENVLSVLPAPNSKRSNKKIFDPTYPKLSLCQSDLTDQFYDSGLYKIHWEKSKFLKTNHPFMGRMSFPEKLTRPSRTLTATNIGTSREAIIYPSEFGRKGDGEYRIPTIREMACLMGFPITYQFLGKSNAKKRLVGNAVCPTLSGALSRKIAEEIGYEYRSIKFEIDRERLESVPNLNTYTSKEFKDQPKRNPGARFRRHPFKYGNITVTLSNYKIGDKPTKRKKWQTSIQYGNGHGYPNQPVPDNFYKNIEDYLFSFNNGEHFVKYINNGFSERIPDRATMQHIYEGQKDNDHYLCPIELVEIVRDCIDSLEFKDELFEQRSTRIFKHKNEVPIKQLFALYAINKISTTSNNR